MEPELRPESTKTFNAFVSDLAFTTEVSVQPPRFLVCLWKLRRSSC